MRKLGNIRTGMPQPSSGGQVQPVQSSGLRKVGNIKTGVTVKRQPAPRPDIKQSVHYKNAVSNAEKYQKEADAANQNVATWESRKNLPKEVLKMMTRAALGVGDVVQRVNPTEYGKNIDAGIKEMVTGDKNVPASVRFQKGRTARQARPLMWEQFTGKSVTNPDSSINQEAGRQFVGDAASAPTYAYSGSKAFLGNPTGNIATRMLKRAVGSVPEAAVNTGIQQFQQGNTDNIGTNFRNNVVAMALLSNVFGEGGRAIRKVAGNQTPQQTGGEKLPDSQQQPNSPLVSDGVPSMTGKGMAGRSGQALGDTSYPQSTPTTGKVKPPIEGPDTRGFKETLASDATTPKDVFETIPGYKADTNKAVFEAVAPSVGKDPRGVAESLIRKGTNLTREESAQAQLLIRKFISDGDIESAKQIARRTSTSATETARALEILSSYHKLTPEGAFRNALKMVDEYNAKNPTSPVDLTPEKAVEIQNLAENVQKATPGTREWQIAAALLEKSQAAIIPVTRLGKLSKLQTMAQLLNPKTLIRNIGGNTALDFLEDVSRAVGAGIDTALHTLGYTTERNVMLPNMKINWLAKSTGFKMGLEDVKLGIRTSGSTGKYNILQDAFAPGSVLNKLEKALGYELSSFDKAFYNGRYMASLDELMRAKKVTTPTPLMRDIADSEALYATFQNNGALANALSKTKRALNFGKEWGLGDLILKYPKTPGNIVQVGMDYSPIGFVKGLKQFYDSVKILDPALQRQAILNVSRGITGSGLILGGAMMAKQGIITADPEKDPDIRQLKREAGQGPFSLNLSALGRFFKGGDTAVKRGDKIVSYDWLQPNAIQLSMGANMVLNKSGDDQINAALESMSTGLDTVTEQPVFSGIKRFVSNLDTSRGGGIGKALSQAVAGAPASMVPSFLNQVGQFTDDTARETYSPNALESSINKAQARVPWLRENLQPRIGTLGQEQPTYSGGNNSLTNVFLNPAFVNTYDVSPVAQEVIDIYTRSGETKQAPRIAPKTLKIDGENYKLSPEQYTQYQTFIGTNTETEFQKLIQDPDFQSMNDGQKADAMSAVLTKVAQAGREDLALSGSLPKSSEQQAKDYLRQGDMDGYREFVLEHPELNTKSDFTRLMNELKKEGFNQEEKAQYDEILKRRKEKTNKPFFTP